MQTIGFFVVIVSVTAAVVYKLWSKKGTQYDPETYEDKPFPPEWEEVLQREVSYYRVLPNDRKQIFRDKVQRFINTKSITGGGAVHITTELLVLTAASAVIPIMGLKGWPYYSLEEVVLVPDNVRNPSDVKSLERSNILGMVMGEYASHTVFLSADALVAGFKDRKDSQNVGIHEFAHMIDGDDGQVDGIPALYMPKELIPEWKALMEEKIELIEEGKSKIDPYAATNDQEFFAVLSEAFFENPSRVKNEMPKVYNILSKVYHQV